MVGEDLARLILSLSWGLSMVVVAAVDFPVVSSVWWAANGPAILSTNVVKQQDRAMK